MSSDAIPSAAPWKPDSAGMSRPASGRPRPSSCLITQKAFDVTGAGDTVVATLALALAAGAPMRHAAKLANYAAGIVVGMIGTGTVTSAQLDEALTRG